MCDSGQPDTGPGPDGNDGVSRTLLAASAFAFNAFPPSPSVTMWSMMPANVDQTCSWSLVGLVLQYDRMRCIHTRVFYFFFYESVAAGACVLPQYDTALTAYIVQ